MMRENLHEPIRLYLFEIPTVEHKSLDEQLTELRGRETFLGHIPTLRAHGQETPTLSLKPCQFYDVLSTAQYGCQRMMSGAGRFSTQQGKMSDDLTLDELKLVVIEYLGLINSIFIAHSSFNNEDIFKSAIYSSIHF